MSHGIHPSMKEREPVALQPVIDGAPTDPGGEQLHAADDAVLALRERGDRLVNPTFAPYVGVNVGFGAHAVIVAAKV